MKTQLHRNRIIQVADIDISHSVDIRQFLERKWGQINNAQKTDIYDSYTLVLNLAIVTNQNCLDIQKYEDEKYQVTNLVLVFFFVYFLTFVGRKRNYIGVYVLIKIKYKRERRVHITSFGQLPVTRCISSKRTELNTIDLVTNKMAQLADTLNYFSSLKTE